MPLLGRSPHDVGMDARRSRRLPLRLPSVAAQVAILAAITLAIFGVLVFRLWLLQILDSQSYVAQAENNSLRTRRGQGAARRDRRPHRPSPRRQPARPRRRHQAHGRAARASSPRWPRASRLSCTCRPRPCWPSSPSSPGCPYDLVIVKRDVSRSLVSYLLEHDQSFPGVEIQQNYLRAYPLGDLAAPVLGYLGQIDPAGAQAGQVQGLPARRRGRPERRRGHLRPVAAGQGRHHERSRSTRSASRRASCPAAACRSPATTSC